MDLLTQRDGLYFHGTELFSGIGFEEGEHQTGNEQTVRSFEFQNGVRVGPYRPVVAVGHPVDLQVEFTKGVEAYELTLYKGERFSGVAYMFADGFCYNECLFTNGHEGSKATWLNDGTMVLCSLDNGEFGEGYEWYESGQLKSVGVSTSDSFVGSLSFTEDGLLRFLKAARGFLPRLTEIRSKLKLRPIQFPITKAEDLQKMRAAQETILSGDEIDVALLQSMVESGVFQDTRKVKIKFAPHLTKLGPLASVTSLRAVELQDMRSDQVALGNELKQLKEARPNLQITYDRSIFAA